MTAEIRKYEVTILGESYTLVSDQEEQHVRNAGQKVAEITNEILRKAPHLEHKKVAVLAALKIAGMLALSESDLEAFKIESHRLTACIDEELTSMGSL